MAIVAPRLAASKFSRNSNQHAVYLDAPLDRAEGLIVLKGTPKVRLEKEQSAALLVAGQVTPFHQPVDLARAHPGKLCGARRACKQIVSHNQLR